MFHKYRQHNVTEVTTHATVRGFIIKFEKYHTWSCCTAFMIDPGLLEYKSKPALLIANDSTSADGGQEYAIFYRKDDSWVMFESFSVWNDSLERFEQFLTNCLENILKKGTPSESMDPLYTSFKHTRVTFDENHRCRHCA